MKAPKNILNLFLVVFLLVAGFVLVFSSESIASPQVGPFIGKVSNLTHYQNKDLTIKAVWHCLQGLIERHSCGRIVQTAKIDSTGAYVIPNFEVPRLDLLEFGSITLEIETPYGSYIADDSRRYNFAAQNGTYIFAEVLGTTLNPALKNGQNINEWLKTTAPNAELNLTRTKSGGNQANDGFQFDSLRAFPLQIPSQFFVFNSAEDFANGVHLRIELTSSQYDSGGDPALALLQFSYSGPFRSDAFAGLENLTIDSSQVKNEISGHWVGTWLPESDYGVKIKMALSHGDLDVVFDCHSNQLSGRMALNYGDDYDQPISKHEFEITNGQCRPGFAQMQLDLPLKEYLGPKLFSKSIILKFNQSISNNFAFASVLDSETNEVLGRFRLSRR